MHAGLALLVTITAAAHSAHAQSAFDAPPAAAPGTPTVRGLYDPNPNAMPSGPIGAQGAPAATFSQAQNRYDLITPTGPTPDDIAPLATQASPPPAEEPTPVPIEGAEIVARVDGQVIL